jgi:hypothetical protein
VKSKEKANHPINKEKIMRALHTALVLETGRAWNPVVIVNARRPMKERVDFAAMRTLFRNMALFLMAPFVGLLYAILLPFVGLGMLAWFAGRALIESGKVHTALRAGRALVMFAAAPLAGLLYIIALPFAGLAMLAWFRCQSDDRGTRQMKEAPSGE